MEEVEILLNPEADSMQLMLDNLPHVKSTNTTICTKDGIQNETELAMLEHRSKMTTKKRKYKDTKKQFETVEESIKHKHKEAEYKKNTGKQRSKVKHKKKYYSANKR